MRSRSLRQRGEGPCNPTWGPSLSPVILNSALDNLACQLRSPVTIDTGSQEEPDGLCQQSISHAGEAGLAPLYRLLSALPRDGRSWFVNRTGRSVCAVVRPDGGLRVTSQGTAAFLLHPLPPPLERALPRLREAIGKPNLGSDERQ